MVSPSLICMVSPSWIGMVSPSFDPVCLNSFSKSILLGIISSFRGGSWPGNTLLLYPENSGKFFTA